MQPTDIDLTPVRERVAWAGRHVERMRKLVDAYVSERPFSVYLSMASDGTTVIEEARLTADPPTQLSLVLGDVTHHLRATLDNLVGAVAVGGPTRASAFPIARDRGKFDQMARAMLRDVPAWGVDVIRELQPFGRDAQFQEIGADLAALDLLAQRDRHRALVLHAPIMELGSFLISGGSPIEFNRVNLTERRIDARTTQVSYSLGTLVRPDYRVRVVVAEEIERIREREVVSLSEGWLETMLEVVEIMDSAIDGAWHRGQN